MSFWDKIQLYDKKNLTYEKHGHNNAAGDVGARGPARREKVDD